MAKEKLLGKSPEELKEAVASVGLPAFTAKQIAQWMYEKKVRDFDSMTNISREGRARLSEHYDLGLVTPSECFTSADGTRKYLFDLEGGAVEAVMIPDEDRKTLCVSSQIGCKMSCKFCMTGRQGFHGNLSVSDILSQFLAIDEAQELTNTVFMGMGEPLDNYAAVKKAIDVLTAPWGFAWSPKRITLSTIGVIPVLKQYLDECRCHLAVSLHNPFPEERFTMMPIQKAYDIRDVVELLKKYDFSGQRRVSFEYTMFGGWNDDLRHARALVRLLGGLECRVNLIRFHRIPDFPYECSSPQAMTAFRDFLNANGITCTIRASRGEDILAACGLLAGKHNRK
jgi:23S rRNA (adenine2503-C2)-methyltransferase